VGCHYGTVNVVSGACVQGTGGGPLILQLW